MTESPDLTLTTDTNSVSSATTRRSFLALGAVTGAAVIVLPALPARALDLGLASELKFLENVQFFQNQFFSRALRSGLIDPLTPREGKALLTIATEDGDQARWFSAARAQRGLMPSRATMPSSMTEPNFQMNNNYASREKFFASAITIKSTAVGAFHGIVGKGGKADMVQAMAALAGVQNRHLAMLKEMARLSPFDNFVTPLSVQEVGKTLSKFGFGTEI